MTAEETINLIQQKIRSIKITAAACDPDEWLMDEVNGIQHIINDYRNQEFKSSEPDPFC